MKKEICKNCEEQFSKDLEFCPSCGYYNESFEGKNPKESNSYNKHLEPIKEIDVLLEIKANLDVIKIIMFFFTALWVLGLIIGIFLWF